MSIQFKIIAFLLSLQIGSYAIAKVYTCKKATCDLDALTRLDTQTGSTEDALKTLVGCLDYIACSDILGGIPGCDGEDCMCKDDATKTPLTRLANFLSRITTYEVTNSTFCCTETQCKEGCPTANPPIINTCALDNNGTPVAGKPIPPAILDLDTTDEAAITTIIKNAAGRITALLSIYTAGE